MEIIMENPMNDMYEALDGAADGAFAVDEELRIHIWNDAAEDILGYENADVVGQKCYQVLKGYDGENRLVCKACCHVAHLALKPLPVSNYDIRVRTSRGDRRWLNMSTITLKIGEEGDKKMIVHLFRDISHKKDDELLLHKILEIARRYHKIPLEPGSRKDLHQLVEKLTRREREVLALLTRGLTTKEIAETLSISPHTVRNHIQNILDKLEVHSRVEAITYTLQNR
jgi:PAS domain S-box-containing protein